MRLSYPLLILGVTCGFGAHAQQVVEQPTSRFELRVGAQAFNSFSTRLRVDSDTLGIGTELELESVLSVEESINIGRLDILARINAKHAVAISYYDINRDGLRVIGQDIDFGDSSYPNGIAVNSKFNQKTVKIAYRYRFLAKPKATLSGSFGLHTLQITTALSALNGSLSEERDADAPLPVIGIQGTYDIGEKWQFNGTVEWFDIQTGDLRGRFLDALIAFEHNTFENGGFGFGYNRLNLRFDSREEHYRGRLSVNFNAAVVFINGRFGSID